MKLGATRVMALAFGAMALMVLAPTSQAATNLYTENFIGNTSSGIALNQAGIGWTADGGGHAVLDGDSRVAGWNSATTPDADFYYTARGPGDSGPTIITATAGEYTVLAASRIDSQFKVDWASSTTKGARFCAEVGGTWYVSDLFGSTASTHGSMAGREVTSWVADQTADVENGTWYEWTYGSRSGVSSTALVGLPAGDITRFGLWWNTTNNSDSYAIDNFRITAVSAGETYVWDGGAGNWADAKWTFGGASNQTPATGYHMFIDTNAGSTVAVDADFSSALTVNVAQSNTAALTVNSSRTLGASQQLNVGPSGTLQVDGTLTTPAVISFGSVTVSDTGAVNASNIIQIADGSFTSSSTGTLNVGTGTLMLDGGTGATLDGPLNITGGTITLNASTLTYNNATSATPAVLVFSGGVLAGTGSVLPTNRYEAYDVTVPYDLTGAPVSLVAGDGTVVLTGNNDYGGDTEIRVASSTVILRVTDASDIPVTGNLYLNSEGRFQDGAGDRPAILETKGTLERDIGTGAGQIRFAIASSQKSSASFAAYGGPLE
ncbi:MAG: hypothetical protein OSA97_14485, partial [Nevskia sp.]|nr:hypothetical protein [Nevskia sp.]